MILKSISLRAYPELDSIRLISIFLVVLHHQFLDQNTILNWLGTYGWVGVDLFFVLSGFLITNLLKLEFEKNAKINLKKFWLKRMIRLWPSWLFTQALTIPIIYYMSRNNVQLRYELVHKFWHYLLHFGNYSYAYFGSLHTLYGHFWSLAVEEHFYLIWPLFLIALLKKPKNAVSIFIFLLIIPYAFRVFHTLNHDPHVIIKLSTHTRFDELILGCILSLNFHRLPKLTVWLEFTMTFMMFLFFFLGLQILDPINMTPYLSEFNFTFIGVASCILIWIALKGSQNGIRRILQVQIISKLGILSYGVYLIHMITNVISYGIIRNWYPGRMDQNIIAIVNFIIPFFPAYLMYKLIDQKFEILKKKIH